MYFDAEGFGGEWDDGECDGVRGCGELRWITVAVNEREAERWTEMGTSTETMGVTTMTQTPTTTMTRSQQTPVAVRPQTVVESNCNGTIVLEARNGATQMTRGGEVIGVSGALDGGVGVRLGLNASGPWNVCGMVGMVHECPLGAHVRG